MKFILMMICIICDSEFIKTGCNQKYCSKECYKIHQNNKEKRKEYYQENKEYYQERYQNNKEEIKEQVKQYKKDNKEKGKERYQDNKEEIKEYYQEYYQDNKEEIKEKSKEYQQSPKGKEVSKRSRDKRQRSLGFIPLNEYFEGSHGHHINHQDVIYIPKSWHFNGGHSVTRNKNMEPINSVAHFFLTMQNIDKFMVAVI